MSWFPVDDGLHSHPKAKKAGDEALGMWTRAGSHCMNYLTDGFVADWWIKEQPRGVVKMKRLLSADLWYRGEKDGETGCWFHDWKPECTKAHVLEMREKARQRKAKQRESQGQSRVTDGAPDAGVLGLTQPNPTQPINSLVAFGGELTQVSRFCPAHPEGTPKPCPACADARRAYEAQQQAQQQNELAKRRAHRAAINACPVCDENGMRSAPGGLKHCTHQEEAHA